MKNSKLYALCTLLALLLVPVAMFAQEQAAPEHGIIEFGFRGVTGEVYGRTAAGTVPFSNGFRPNLVNSGLNAYSDYRNGFYVPKFNLQLDSFLGSDSYLRIQSASNGLAFQDGGSLSRNQSVLVSLGQYGHYKMQFRYDQTPHIFSGTTRTLFTSGGPGVWNVNPAVQSAMFTALCGSVNATTRACTVSPTVTAISNAFTNAVAGSLVAGASGVNLFTQQENRKTITGLLNWNITPDVNVYTMFSREHQVGTRPIGFVMGNSSSGYIAEAPESIDYYTNTFNITSEFGQKSWVGSVGYQGQFFQNNIPSMIVANPVSNVYNQVTSTMSSTVGPATGRMDLYPDNKYQQFIGQGAVELGKRIHLMANVTPGWISQTANFQPLTTNTFLTLTPPAGYPAFVPEQKLDGKVDTLAMNYTAVFKPRKDLTVVAKYQHYGYDNKTPDMLVRPTVADTSFLLGSSFHGSTAGCYDPTSPTNSVLAVTSPTAGNPSSQYTYYCDAEQSSFTSKLFDIGGTWFFTKKSSVKFGYQRGWMDRTHREVEETIEDSLYAAADLHLNKNLLLRISGRHQNRMPQGGVAAYEADSSNFYARMLDQATRARNRGDVSLQWDATQKLSFSAFWGTLQDNFNIRNSVNSLVPLGNGVSPVLVAGSTPTPIYGPYYAYGLLNSIGRNYGVDVNYALTPNVVLFAQYGREKNTALMIQGRALNPTGTDTDPINDLLTAPKDVVNSYYLGVDTTTKKLDFSVYYNLSLAQSFNFSDGVNCQIGSGMNSYCDTHFTNWKLDTTANPAVNFGSPQDVNRIHEVGAIARFKLTENLIPKFQYVFRQYAYSDWQTGAVNPYSYVGTGIDPNGATTLHKILFLGADQPSYRAHVFTATLEYRF